MENKQSEQGQVSAPAKPKDENQSNVELATKYQVEPKLIRLLDELIERKLAPPEQAEAQEQTAEQEQPEEPCISQQTQERLKSYYKNLDPRAKLAIATLSEIQCLDGINFQARQKEGKLYDDIWYELQKTCIETFHKDFTEGDFDIAPDDIWLNGVWEAVRMVLQNT